MSEEFGDLAPYVQKAREKQVTEREGLKSLFWDWHHDQGFVTLGAATAQIERFASELQRLLQEG